MISLKTIFLMAAVAVVIILAVIAAYYLLMLRNQRNAQVSALNELKATQEKQRRERVRSIQILSKAALNDDVTLTEACIRISALSDVLRLSSDYDEVLNSPRALAKETAHIPILKDWKGLSKKQKSEFEKQRFTIEAKYRDFVLTSFKKLGEEGYIS